MSIVNKNKQSRTGGKIWLSSGLLAAFAASLCCITPVVAILGGIGGIASAFSWIDPLRPYLIGSTALFLSLAWYTTLSKSKMSDVDCDCETEPKKKSFRFLNSRKFLGLITIVSALLLAFPSYSHIFFPDIIKDDANTINVELIEYQILQVEGMTCAGCEESVNYKLLSLDGVLNVESNHIEGIVKIKYNSNTISLENIIASIDEVGYKVIGTSPS